MMVYTRAYALLLGIVAIPLIISIIFGSHSLSNLAPEVPTIGNAQAPARQAGVWDIFPNPKTPVEERCQQCHEVIDEEYVMEEDHFLNGRAELDQQKWAETINLQFKCGSCHLVPDPSHLPLERWGEVMTHMGEVLRVKEWLSYSKDEWSDIMHYYYVNARMFEKLPPDPPASKLFFESSPFGIPAQVNEHAKIGNVNVVDLDQDGKSDVLVGDFDRNVVSWIHNVGGIWTEQPLGRVEIPGHTAVFDEDNDGDLDIAVASVGFLYPTDSLVGSVMLLVNMGDMTYQGRTILRDVGRLSDVRPGDFDGDGDYDFVVSIFGYMNQGEIGWLENKGEYQYKYHRLSNKTGGVNVIPTDINADGMLDFIALISQEHEEVTAFINKGNGFFVPEILFKAITPAYGSSGIEMLDMDNDGDQDVLYTNGDAFDLQAPLLLPYQGVQWLENKGDLTFEYHDIMRFYGAYRAVPGDMDNDGDMDIVVCSILNDWDDSTRQSIVWLENDGKQNFTPHGVGNNPNKIISISLGDIDGDGWQDIVSGSMNIYYPDVIEGRVALWRNMGSASPRSD